MLRVQQDLLDSVNIEIYYVDNHYSDLFNTSDYKLKI